MRGRAVIDLAARVARDYATGPDGRTFAIGRALGVGLFVGATPLPVIVGAYEALTGKPQLADWAGFFGAAGAYYGAVAAAAVGLIQLTTWSEPKAPADPQPPSGARP